MTFADNFWEELRSLGESIVEWAILILVALLVLVIGRWILQWVRKVIERVLALPALNGLWDQSGVTKALEPSGQTPAKITASIAYAYLMVLLWLVAVRIVKLDTIEDLLERLLAWIPLLLVSAAIVIIAAAVANWAADLIRPFAVDKSVPWLTWLIRIAILVFGVLFAFDILAITFAEDIVKIIVFASGVGLAIAFGVGGIDAAKLWWAKYGTPGSSKTGGGDSGGAGF
ncbi:MAG: hypothetical protein DWP92_03505 [Armatimonadetes bacterium]|nr:MAG: hypothetical protein DWP92_03505 [Armatimonadota bacterium]